MYSATPTPNVCAVPDAAAQTTRRPRAVLYSRLSRESLVSTSLAGQAEDLQALADRECWDVVASYVDEGLSGGKQRANAEAAVSALAEGRADVLAAYAVDRFSRQGIGEDARLVQAVRRGASRAVPPRVVFVREGIDSTADPAHWALRFSLASETARGEREVMVARRKASLERMAKAGRFDGRGAAPWGYRSAPYTDGRPGRTLVVDAAEAAVIREVAARLLADESTVAVAADLNARGVPTPRSAYRLAVLAGRDAAGADRGTWSPSRVVHLLESRRLVGWIMRGTSRARPDEDADDAERPPRGVRQREGSPVLDTSGLPLQAFEPILDVATSDALRDRFSLHQGRGTQRKRRAARLLSGLLFCGTCEAPMYVLTSRQNGRERAYYRCSGKSIGNGCPGVSVTAQIAEDTAEERYLAAVGRLPAFEIRERREGTADAARLALITERIAATASAMTEPGADRRALLDELDRLDGMRADLLAVEPRIVTETVDLGRTFGEIYAEGDTGERRRLLGLAWDHVLAFRPNHAERFVYVPRGDLEPIDAD